MDKSVMWRTFSCFPFVSAVYKNMMHLLLSEYEKTFYSVRKDELLNLLPKALDRKKEGFSMKN